ncbi:MAG: tRNA uridine-5-carboxymethylaminomethyl(34) synthesis GTPase MnmE [Bacteroidales bacterium]|nr:tRNA uridine-5-carboxymethylaminomethyl(34) synthesis GTPase MnmE [Bacteroidales bacterium]
MQLSDYIFNTDPITAIATGGNASAIAVIRCSGVGVIEKVATVFKPKNPLADLNSTPGYKQIFGSIFDKEKILDEVIVSVYRQPHSFTGEDSIEINCHGSVYIQKKILSLLHSIGIRPAQAGEFTLRAWKNQKYDLAQAEAIADLIDSRSETSHRIAMQHLNGHFSNTIQKLRMDFIHFASLLELELDFAEEEVEFADREKFTVLIDELSLHIQQLIDSYHIGKVLKEGIPVAIIGKPNVGKSSLLNLLLEDDKAIVSDIEGTTRDLIEDVIDLKGYLFRFIDTAGIRQSEDLVEKLGIDRSKKAMERASIIMYMIDEKGITADDEILLEQLVKSKKLIIKLQNKTDQIQNPRTGWIPISAINRKGIEQIVEHLLSFVESYNINDRTIVTSSRHVFLLNQALKELIQIQNDFKEGIPTDLIAISVRSAMNYLSEITGTIHVDNLLENIFSKFCIGK